MDLYIYKFVISLQLQVGYSIVFKWNIFLMQKGMKTISKFKFEKKSKLQNFGKLFLLWFLRIGRTPGFDTAVLSIQVESWKKNLTMCPIS